AMKNLGLITSHGFGPYAGDMTSLGNDILRAKNPGLHSWVTSMAWGNKEGQELDFINQIRLHIYEAKVNGIIPWTIIQCPSQRIGWGGNTGTGFMVDEKGNFIVKPNYYFFKQVCRAGQPGMAVARAISKDSQLCLIAFSGNGTGNPDAFVLVNLSERPKMLDVKISGSLSKSFNAYRTCFSFFQRFGTSAEKYASLGDFNASNGTIAYIARPRSVTTFFAKESKD
ncbi:MAG: hypothetical protein NWF14_04495, partial [Candidatus Bathyarchaeota archaeon]|nr:hypothetical protein [Candidatus Bathyarchaeota archaeon]